MLNLKVTTCEARLRDAIQAVKKTLVVLPIKEPEKLIEELNHWEVKSGDQFVFLVDKRAEIGDKVQSIVFNEPISDFSAEDLRCFAHLISRRKLQGEFKFAFLDPQVAATLKEQFDIAITTENGVSTMF